MKKINLILALLISIATAFGQNVTVKNPTGNGPVLSVSLDGINAYPTGAQFIGRHVGDKYAFVSFSLNGMVPTTYKYNGKTYPIPFYGDEGGCLCQIYLDQSSSSNLLAQQVTVVIRVKGKTYTQTAKNFRNFNFTIPLEDEVKKEDISVQNVSITVEPGPNNWIETRLEQYVRCLKLKENEKKAKGQQTAKKDDFWSGGEEKKQTTASNNQKGDFWSGNETKSNSASNDFWASGNNSSKEEKRDNYKICSEGSYSWVEDENGNKLIPKGSYYIQEYKDGLARVRKTTGTDYHSELGNITLYEYSYINSKGEVIPPIRKTVYIPRKATGGVLKVRNDQKIYYNISEAEYRAIKAKEERAKEEAQRAREQEDRRYNDALRSVRSKYIAMGYEIE